MSVPTPVYIPAGREDPASPSRKSPGVSRQASGVSRQASGGEFSVVSAATPPRSSQPSVTVPGSSAAVGGLASCDSDGALSSQTLRPESVRSAERKLSSAHSNDVGRPARIAKHKVELQQAQFDLKKCLTHSKDIQHEFFKEMSACGESMSRMKKLFKEEIFLCKQVLASERIQPAEQGDTPSFSADHWIVVSGGDSHEPELLSSPVRDVGSSHPAGSIRFPPLPVQGSSPNRFPAGPSRFSPRRGGSPIPTRSRSKGGASPGRSSPNIFGRGMEAACDAQIFSTPSSTKCSPEHAMRPSPAISTRSETMTPSGSARMLHNSLVMPLQPSMQPSTPSLQRVMRREATSHFGTQAAS